MIGKPYNNTYIVSCDRCSFYEEFEDVYSWSHLIESMKKREWKIVEIAGKWEHYCPVCVEKR